MANYDSEPDEAQKLFWNNMIAAAKEGSTQTRIKILDELKEIKRTIKPLTSFAKVFRDMWRKGAADIDEHVLK